MWKMVWGDLCYRLKPGLKQLSKQFLNYYLYLYLLGFLPLFFEFTWQYLLFYYAGMVPMILAMIFSSVFGGDVNKVLYLCPLSEAERKQYFLVSWGIRALIPSALCLLFEGILCGMHLISLGTALLVVLTVIFFSAVMGMYGGFMVRNADGVAQTDGMPPGYTVCGVVSLLLGIFTMVFLGAVVGDVEEPRFTGGEVGVMLLLFFLHGLTALFIHVKYFRPLMEHMICFEKMERGKGSKEDRTAK
ncbi:MAG: hypothetical protein K2N63_05450 [Lachnospiraceae bacterium]|nr:hypothetical protein [Lachnospiraceae bacterium]